MSSSVKFALILGAFFLTLIAVSLGSYFVWVDIGYVALGFHGWLAIILGTIGILGLGAGLMWLSFYSHRHGIDEQAADHDDLLD